MKKREKWRMRAVFISGHSIVRMRLKVAFDSEHEAESSVYMNKGPLFMLLKGVKGMLGKQNCKIFYSPPNPILL